MVKVTEYKKDQFMVNTTKNEALRIIKSLAAQLYNDDCNRDRVEFGKRHADDVEYFSIAVDEAMTKYHVMTNIGGGNPIHDMTLRRFDTMKEAQKFMRKFKDGRITDDYTIWIKEVQS